MNKFILSIEKWFNSDGNVEINLTNHIDDFSNYSIEKKLFLYDDNIVKENLLNECIILYFNRVEQYIKVYIENFKFINYSNFSNLTEDIDNDLILCFLEWFKEENIGMIKKINEELKEYDVKHFYSVIKYYDFLITNSLENRNYGATLDFLVGFIENVIDRTMELSNKEIYNQVLYTENINRGVIEANLSINKEILENDFDKHILNNFEYKEGSANQQTFLL